MCRAWWIPPCSVERCVPRMTPCDIAQGPDAINVRLVKIGPSNGERISLLEHIPDASRSLAHSSGAK